MATSISGDIYQGILLDTGDEAQDIFTDAFLERIFKKAVRRLNRDLGLSSVSRPKGIPGYKALQVAPITYDISGDSISPDNDEIADLIILQCEYIIKKGEISALKRLHATAGGVFFGSVGGASTDGVSVTNADGVTVDMGGGSRFTARAGLFRMDLETIKEELEEAKKKFLYRLTGNFSKLVY